MIALWIVLIVLIVLAAFWVLALHGKRKQPGFFGLDDYHYAHRGLHAASHGIPENSLYAFRLAVTAGCGAELDVHLSKDGRLVVMHDESLLRTAGVDRNICDMTAPELDALRLEGTNEKIPYLEQVLPLFSGKTPLIIEIKTVNNNHAELTSKVCRLLRDFPQVRFCIESFDPRVLLWLKRHRPKIVRGQLSCNFIRDRHQLSLPLAFLLTNLLTNFLTNPDFIAYKLEDRNVLSFRLCRKLWGVKEFNWTIRREEDADAALRDDRGIIFEGFLPQ